MALPTSLTVGQMEDSGLPPSAKSAIRRWYDGIKQGTSTGLVHKAKLYGASATEGLRAGGEGILVGAALGAIHAQMPQGLDMGSGKVKIPIDAAAGGALLLASIACADQEKIGNGVDLRNAGSAALAVFGFRKTHDLVEARKKTQAGATHAGFAGDTEDAGADPILQAGAFF